MSVTLVVMGLTAPIAGRFVDRAGPRRTLLGGLGLVAAGAASLALTDQPWAFFIGFAVISGVGFSLVSNSTISTTIAVNFAEKRGLATGLATSGSSAGQLLLIPVFAVMLSAGSWRLSFWAITALTVLLFAVLWLALPKAPTTGREGGSDSGRLADDLQYLLRSPAFYLLFLSFFICGITSTGIIETHFMPFVAFCGFPPLPTASAYGILSVLNLGGMILSGWLTDRVNRVMLLASIYFVRGLSFLLLAGVGADYQTVLIFSVIFGIVDYSTVPVTASLVASHLGTKVMGFAMGLIAGGHALGAALGAFGGGILFDAFGSYSIMWLVGVWTAIGAAALVLLMSQTKPTALAAT